jgi:hypothetical protein
MNRVLTVVAGLAVAVIICPLALGQRLIYERRDTGLLDRAIQIPMDEFSRTRILHLSSDFVRKHRAREVARLVIVAREGDAAGYRFGKGQFHTTYHQWVEHFKARVSQSGPLAEVLHLGSASGVRIRSAHGDIEEVILQGHNVFRPTIAGFPLQLLHVHVQPTPVSRHRFQLSFFYRANRVLTVEEGRAVMNTVQDEIPRIPAVAVSIRPDGWFIADAYYPWVNSFDTTVAPPTWEIYSKTVELYCMTRCSDRAAWTVVEGGPSVEKPIPLPTQ